MSWFPYGHQDVEVEKGYSPVQNRTYSHNLYDQCCPNMFSLFPTDLVLMDLSLRQAKLDASPCFTQFLW